MIRGSVSSAAVASVELTLSGPNGVSSTVTLQVDTGFDGHLMLSTEVIRTLQLSLTGAGSAHLADGSAIAVNHYLVEVMWDGSPRHVEALEFAGDPLMGMSMMAGSRLTIDAVPGGNVAIEELP